MTTCCWRQRMELPKPIAADSPRQCSGSGIAWAGICLRAFGSAALSRGECSLHFITRFFLCLKDSRTARMDLMRAIIRGASGTPYHDQLYVFDLQLPSDYPSSPPKVLHHRHIPGSSWNNVDIHKGNHPNSMLRS